VWAFQAYIEGEILDVVGAHLCCLGLLRLLGQRNGWQRRKLVKRDLKPFRLSLYFLVVGADPRAENVGQYAEMNSRYGERFQSVLFLVGHTVSY